tara:strand:- start:10039 stop:10764 length:726 start_codon:yes stop_codon:yes gene_type:complete
MPPAENTINSVRQIITSSITITKFLQIFVYLTPFFTIFFLFIFSVLTNNILKGLIFLSGILFTIFINYLLLNTIRLKQSPNASYLCNLFPKPFSFMDSEGVYMAPSVNVTLLTFCLTYLIIPMINKKYNYPLIFILLILLISDIITEYYSQCINIASAGMGLLLGGILGTAYYYLIKKYDNPPYAEYSNYLKIPSSAEMCSKPGKKNYRCKVHDRRRNPHSVVDPGTVPHEHSIHLEQHTH